MGYVPRKNLCMRCTSDYDTLKSFYEDIRNFIGKYLQLRSKDLKCYINFHALYKTLQLTKNNQHKCKKIKNTQR